MARYSTTFLRHSPGTAEGEADLEEEEEEPDMCFALFDEVESAPRASVVPLPSLCRAQRPSQESDERQLHG